MDKTCFLCGKQADIITESNNGIVFHVNCKTCGIYLIERIVVRILDTSKELKHKNKWMLSALTREASEFNNNELRILKSNYNSLLDSFNANITINERQKRILRYISKYSKPGGSYKELYYPNVINVTVQFTDAAGVDMATPVAVPWYLADDLQSRPIRSVVVYPSSDRRCAHFYYGVGYL